MDSTITRTEIELTRHNVTPAKFLSYVRCTLARKGIRDMSSDLDPKYFAAGNDLNFHYHDDPSRPCAEELSRSKPYDVQTYVRNWNGDTYNEIVEFEFDDEKTGTGYYYLLNITGNPDPEGPAPVDHDGATESAPATDTTTNTTEGGKTMNTTTKATSTTPKKARKNAPKANEPRPEFIEKVKAAFNDAKARLDAGEEMHVHFSEGNSKTHMPSLDLLPLLTCHGRCRELCGKVPAGKYLPPCYAARIANRLPDAMRNYAENTVLAIFRPEQYWQEVRTKMRCCRFMRLFVSGDMIIRGYFDRLCEALEENPHLEMQGFSKCYEIVNRRIEKYGALPKNLHLLLSGWYDYQAINPHRLPESRVFDETLPEGWLTCGGNCANCACVGLGCWKAATGDIVGLKKH